MKNYNEQIRRKEIAIELIKQAVLIKETTFGSPMKEIDVMKEMTDEAGMALGYLLKFGKEENDMADWSSWMYEWKIFIQDLLVLLAKPGVLKKLRKYQQPMAAKKLEHLISFFQSIDEKYTNQWLDFIMLKSIGTNNEEYLSHLVNYYRFSENENNFFTHDYIREKKWFEKMISTHEALQEECK
jgi:hypothetical protein